MAMNMDGADGRAEVERILRQELSQLLASPFFSRSPVQSRLLRYLVGHRLRGDQPPPKAYAIATEALGRPSDFDASIDSYPRVMVGRLRALLERYYSEQPWLYRLRIPQGSYDVVVQYRAAPPSRATMARAGSLPSLHGGEGAADHEVGGAGDVGRQGRGALSAAGGYDALAALLAPALALPDPPQGIWARLMSWLDRVLPQPHALRRWTMMVAAICLAAMLGGGAALLASYYGQSMHSGAGQRPVETVKGLVPLPLVDVRVAASDEQDPAATAMARAVAARIRDGARRFEMLSLRGGQGGHGEQGGGDVDYLIDVMLTPADEGQMDAVVMVYRLADQRSIWSRRFLLKRANAPDFPALDPAISQIAGNYGVIVRDQTGQLADDYRKGFPCLAQFQRMRVSRQQDGFDKIAACLDQGLKKRPRDPMMLSAQSYMLYNQAMHSNHADKVKEYLEKGTRQAVAAYAADPSSSAAAFARARAYFILGQCNEGMAMARRAEEGNGLDSDMLSRLAILYQFCGRKDEAQRLSTRALMLDPAFPAIAMVARSLVLLEKSKPQEALEQLDGLTNVEAVEAHYYVIQAVAYGQLGLKTNAETAWNRLIALAGMSENARAEDVLRHFRVADIMVRREAMMLRDAGVVPLRTGD
ncbi:tetratricopeptide repeat protein [Sphingopyxis sp. FBM22]|nr:tetratricopeptide repeat protein [Sphingopyxis yananensis]